MEWTEKLNSLKKHNMGDILLHLKHIKLLLKICQKRPVFRAVFLGFFQNSIFLQNLLFAGSNATREKKFYSDWKQKLLPLTNEEKK